MFLLRFSVNREDFNLDKKILAVAGIGVIGVGAYFLLSNTNADGMPMGAGGGGGSDDGTKKETTVTRTEPVTDPSQPIFNIESPNPPSFPSMQEVTGGYGGTTKKQDKSLSGVIGRTHSNVPSGIPTTTYPAATNVSYPEIGSVAPGQEEITGQLQGSTKKQRNAMPSTKDEYLDLVERKESFIPEPPDISGVKF